MTQGTSWGLRVALIDRLPVVRVAVLLVLSII
jgi:hypothetical protein